jgi:hypothetical protein
MNTKVFRKVKLTVISNKADAGSSPTKSGKCFEFMDSRDAAIDLTYMLACQTLVIEKLIITLCRWHPSEPEGTKKITCNGFLLPRFE